MRKFTMSNYSKILGKEAKILKSELESGKKVNWVMSSPFGEEQFDNAFDYMKDYIEDIYADMPEVKDNAYAYLKEEFGISEDNKEW